MEITVDEWYVPSIDMGNYVDRIPKTDVKCPCGSRVHKSYSRQQFSTHIKTQSHQKWLAMLNANKANYYVENEKLKETIRTQQMVLIRLENELRMKTFQLEDMKKRNVETTNLLD